MNAKFFISLIIAFMLGAGVGYYLGYNSRSPSKTGETTSGFRVGQNAIYIPDQVPGRVITVGLVALGEAGFVAIHETKDGKPSTVIGKSDLLTAGEMRSIPPITISREVLDGEPLFAMLHRDNGNRTFNPEEDAIIADDGGEPLMMQFMIDKNAVEPGAVRF